MTMQERARRPGQVADAPVSLRDRAYQEIKRRINRMEFRPGAYLNEAGRPGEAIAIRATK